MRITLFIGTLGAGGAERALVVLADGFNQLGHDVTIVTWIDQEPAFYRIPPGVSFLPVEMRDCVRNARWFDVVSIFKRFSAIRKSIRATTPDIVISFLDGNNELFLLSSIREKYMRILSCQNDISVHKHFNSRWNFLRKWTYSRANLVVFLDDKQACESQVKHPKWKCTGLPNPLANIDLKPDTEEEEIIEWLDQFPNRLTAMGRLTYQKGFDLLLKAFKNILTEHPHTGLVILGEGEMREILEREANDLGVANNILFPGVVTNPHSIIAASEVFVFSSRYEGQGLALLEAMACGVAVISFDCPSGPSLMINNGIDGELVPAEDIVALSNGIIKLLEDKQYMNKLAAEAVKVKEKYSILKVCQQWEGYFRPQ